MICRTPAWDFCELVLVGSGDVAMPVKYRDSAVAQQRVDALELIIDETFQRRDIQNLDRPRSGAFDLGDDREKDRFGFTGGGVRAEDQVVVRIENDLGCRDLNRPKRFPAVCVDKVLDERGKAVEDFVCVHMSSVFLIDDSEMRFLQYR